MTRMDACSGNDIDTNLPAGFDVHLVVDNYGTHKVTKVQAWLARHPRYDVHFTPNQRKQVERLFAERPPWKLHCRSSLGNSHA